MRIHSDILTGAVIIEALNKEITRGRIAPSVNFKTLTKHGSRTHGTAYEVQLESAGKLPGDGRRNGNSGQYGATSGSDYYAATYDEWGWLLAALFALDPNMKTTYYEDVEAFDHQTGLSYNPRALLRYLTDESGAEDPDDGWDPYPYVSGKNTVGRRGYGRVYIDESASRVRYCREEPRTVAWVREFARMDAVASSAAGATK